MTPIRGTSPEAAVAPRSDEMTERALAFFEALIGEITMKPSMPNYEWLVGEIAHGRGEIAAARDRLSHPEPPPDVRT